MVGAGRALPFATHVRETLALGLPLVATQLAQVAMGVTDTVMVGWLGAEELAAVVLGTQAWFILFVFGAAFSHAVMPLAASARGAGDERMVRRSVRMGLWIMAAYALACVVAMSFLEPVLLFLRQDPQAAAGAASYMDIARWSFLPALAIMGLRAFATALERTRIVLWATIAAALVNVLLNYAFIFGNFGAPEMGVRGAAVATLGSNVIGLLVIALWSVRNSAARTYALFERFWRPDWPALREVVRLGLPIGGTIIAEVALFLFASIMMGWLGIVSLAAHGIALQLASIAFMIPLGMGNAATVRIGLAKGRGDMANLRRAALTVLVLSAGVTVFTATMFWLFPEFLISLYLDEANPQAQAIVTAAVPLLAVAAGFQLVDSMQAIGAGLLRGLKDTRVPMMIAMASYWAVGLPMAWTLGFPAGFGGPGVWTGLAAGLTVAAITMNWRFFRMIGTAGQQGQET